MGVCREIQGNRPNSPWDGSVKYQITNCLVFSFVQKTPSGRRCHTKTPAQNRATPVSSGSGKALWGRGVQGRASGGPGMETRGDVGKAEPVASRWAQERAQRDRQSLLSAA